MPVARYGVIYLHLHLKSPFSVMKINEATCSEAAAKCHLKEAVEKPKMPRKNSSDRMLPKGSKLGSWQDKISMKLPKKPANHGRA